MTSITQQNPGQQIIIKHINTSRAKYDCLKVSHFSFNPDYLSKKLISDQALWPIHDFETLWILNKRPWIPIDTYKLRNTFTLNLNNEDLQINMNLDYLLLS